MVPRELGRLCIESMVVSEAQRQGILEGDWHDLVDATEGPRAGSPLHGRLANLPGPLVEACFWLLCQRGRVEGVDNLVLGSEKRSELLEEWYEGVLDTVLRELDPYLFSVVGCELHARFLEIERNDWQCSGI